MVVLNLLIAALFSVLGLFDASGEAGDAGAGDAGGTGAAGQPAGSGTATGDAGAAGAGEAASGEDANAQAGTKLTDPAALQKALDRANAQAAAERKKRTEAETSASRALEAFKPIAKMLGFDTGDTVDPADLQKRLDETQQKYRSERLTNAFHRVASQVGAKAELTLRYLRGGTELAELDPEADGFEEQLKTIVQEAIDKVPDLKATQAAARSGGEFNGGGEAARDYSAMSIDDLRKEHAKARGAGV